MGSKDGCRSDDWDRGEEPVPCREGGGSDQPVPESPFNLSATVDALLQPHAGEKEGYRLAQGENYVPSESMS